MGVTVVAGVAFAGWRAFLPEKWNRGVLLLFAIAGMFVFGLLMRGRMFEPVTVPTFSRPS